MTDQRQKSFNALLIPVILCIWILPFITISQPDDWRVSRFGTVPVLPPSVISKIKLLGRLAAMGITGFALVSVLRHRRLSKSLATLLPWIAFCIFGIGSTVWSALPSISLKQSITFTLLVAISVYLGAVWRNDRDTEGLVKHLGVALALLSGALLVLHFAMPRSGALTKEAAGVLHSTNAGAAAGLGVVLTIAARLIWNSRWSRWWFFIIGVEAASMLVGANRLSIAVTGVVSVLLLVVVGHRAMIAKLVFGISVTCMLYVCADPHLSLAKMTGESVGVFAKQGQTKQQLSKLSGREEMWEKMWDSFTESPILGHGYFVSTKRGRLIVWGEWGNWTAHSFPLQVLVTTGLIGFSLLLLGYVTLLLGVIRCSTREFGGETKLLLSMVSLWFLGWGILNSSIVGPMQPESVVFAVCLGVGAGLCTARTDSHLGEESSRDSDFEDSLRPA